ncbi:MAG: transporter [Bdellovibrionales bacterium]|nr:transporter [Bdellovibrionales bacterium]
MQNTKERLLGSLIVFKLFILPPLWFPNHVLADEVPEVEQEEPVDGDIADPYDVFDPVPASLMRPMVTDRPTFVDSPHTVDAGHFQLETSLVDYEKDVTSGGTTETFLVNQMNLKMGLNLDADAQVIVQSYKSVRAPASTRGGFGDITLRLKFNLFGNDRGNFAGGLIPFLKVPVSSQVGNGMFEGGLYFPFEWKANEDWSFILMVGPEFMKNASDSRFHFELAGGAALSTRIATSFMPFVEYRCRYNGQTRVYTANVGGGLAYAIGANWHVDAGMDFGVNSNSSDTRFYFGTSFRI